MILQSENAALFYRTFGALLTWVNNERGVVPQFVAPTPERETDLEATAQVRKALWADDSLRERYLAEHPELPDAERELVSSWQHRVSESFVIERHLKKHSIFLATKVYAALGIYSPLSELVPSVPAYVTAVLLPFRNVIIIDGILEAPAPFMTFGGGAKRSFREQYSAARKAGRIVTSLPPAT